MQCKCLTKKLRPIRKVKLTGDFEVDGAFGWAAFRVLGRAGVNARVMTVRLDKSDRMSQHGPLSVRELFGSLYNRNGSFKDWNGLKGKLLKIYFAGPGDDGERIARDFAGQGHGLSLLDHDQTTGGDRSNTRWHCASGKGRKLIVKPISSRKGYQ